MILAFLALMAAFLLFKLLLIVINRFIAWLGRGKMLTKVVEEDKIEAAYAEQIRQFVQSWEDVRLKRKLGVKKLASPRMTRDEKKALYRGVKKAREEYLSLMKLSWYQVVIIFLVGSVLGLVLEQIWMYLTAGLTESRVGLVWGPFSPLYGFGSVFLTIACWALRKKNVSGFWVFITSVCVGGILEQITGWTMENYFDAVSWSYLHLPDHITQWVAWRFLFFWGLIGLIWYKYIMPEVLFRIGMPTTMRQVVFVSLLAFYITADIFMTMSCFIRKTERDQGIPASNKFEVWIDENYTDQFIAARFQNLVIGSQSS